MSRKFAQIQVDMWNDDDILELSPMAQWLYIYLRTNGDTNFCGVTDWRPKRIVPKAIGLTVDVILSAAQELEEGLFVVIDDDTEEALVRSFLRHDKVLEGSNMAKPVARDWQSTASKHLRGVIVHELNRLHQESPKLKNWTVPDLQDVLGRTPIDPREMPSPNPSGKAWGMASPTPIQGVSKGSKHSVVPLHGVVSESLEQAADTDQEARIPGTTGKSTS